MADKFDTGADALLAAHRKIERDWYADWQRRQAERLEEVMRRKSDQQSEK